MTLQRMFEEAYKRNIIDFRIRIQPTERGTFKFYIHALGHDSVTLDFEVWDDALNPDAQNDLSQEFPECSCHKKLVK